MSVKSYGLLTAGKRIGIGKAVKSAICIINLNLYKAVVICKRAQLDRSDFLGQFNGCEFALIKRILADFSDIAAEFNLGNTCSVKRIAAGFRHSRAVSNLCKLGAILKCIGAY